MNKLLRLANVTLNFAEKTQHGICKPRCGCTGYILRDLFARRFSSWFAGRAEEICQISINPTYGKYLITAGNNNQPFNPLSYQIRFLMLHIIVSPFKILLQDAFLYLIFTLEKY